MDNLFTESFVLLVLVFVLGACLGSFINVLVYRIPMMMFRDWHQQCHDFLQEHPTPPTIDEKFGIARPRSHCPVCKQVIKPWHNIPLVSFILLRGKCYTCKTRFSIRYPLIELLAAMCMLAIVLHFGLTWLTVAICLFSGFLITLTFIDFEYHLLPDQLTISLLWIGLMLNAFNLLTDSQSAILGAVSAYTTLWIIGFSFHKLTGKEGMGYGDYKLFAAIGAWLGWQSLIGVILLASIIGIVVTLILMLCRKHQYHQSFAFGPYLAIAAWVYIMWGNHLQLFYWNVVT